MSVQFKPGVVVPPSVRIAVAVGNVARTLNLPALVVTSGNDSKHMKGSKHYSDEALDFRTKNLTKQEKHALIEAVRMHLGPDYDVILESEGKMNEHLHIEYDPA